MLGWHPQKDGNDIPQYFTPSCAILPSMSCVCLLSAQLQSELSWMTLQDRREMQIVSKVHSCLQRRAPAYLCSKFSRNLNAEYIEKPGVLITSTYNTLAQISTESPLSLMGLTYGTNFPGLPRQSGLMKHLGRLLRSICFILYKLYHSIVLFWCFVLTHLFLSCVLALVFCKLVTCRTLR